jgi:hypothetical protein
LHLLLLDILAPGQSLPDAFGKGFIEGHQFLRGSHPSLAVILRFILRMDSVRTRPVVIVSSFSWTGSCRLHLSSMAAVPAGVKPRFQCIAMSGSLSNVHGLSRW